MELRTFQIDLDSIEMSETQSIPFDIESKKSELEYFARSIIKLGGLLRIPIVKRTGIEAYQLIEGFFEYFSYLKAREIEPELPDRIRVFIMEGEYSESFETQLSFLKNIESTSASNTNKKSQDQINIQIENFKLYLEEELRKVRRVLQSFEGEIINSIIIKTRTEIAELKTEIIEEIKKKLPPPPLPKQNLRLADKEQICAALKRSGVANKYVNAAWKAMEYWRGQGEDKLNLENLKQCAVGKSEHKIKNFGRGTFIKLQEIFEIE